MMDQFDGYGYLTIAMDISSVYLFLGILNTQKSFREIRVREVTPRLTSRAYRANTEVT